MRNSDFRPATESSERLPDVAIRLKGCEERSFLIPDFNELLIDTTDKYFFKFI